MKKWLRRIRGAVGMGLIWALVWAPIAVLIGTQIVDPDDSMDEMWVMVGALPGFLSGVVFSAVLGIAARRRRLDELSIARVGGWGAVAGLLIGILPWVLGDSGGRPWLFQAVVVITSITLLSAVSAAGSLALAQRVQKRELLDSRANLSSDVGLTEGEVQELYRAIPRRRHEPSTRIVEDS
ncbi:MAG: hypothetical protein ABR543_17785 [Gemmatimonadaceae bacterium]